MTADIESWAWSTWTDELNAALHPLGLLLSGVEAASVLEPLRDRSLLATLRAATEEDALRFAQAANRFLETSGITPAHIMQAIERTRWHCEDV